MMIEPDPFYTKEQYKKDIKAFEKKYGKKIKYKWNEEWVEK